MKSTSCSRSDFEVLNTSSESSSKMAPIDNNGSSSQQDLAISFNLTGCKLIR
jgi:hypothetical protein